MDNDNSISIIVPALNEEDQLSNTVKTLKDSLHCWDEYEIIIVNDGSTDKTYQIAQSLSAGDNRIIPVHNKKSKGKGHCTKQGFQRATGNYLICVNGKNDTTSDQLKKIYAEKGKADIVISCQANTFDRPLIRQILSKLYTKIINILFSKDLKYYNGSILLKKSLYQTIQIEADSYAFEAEMLLKLLFKNHSYTQIDVIDVFESSRNSRAFTLKNISGVTFTVLKLFFQLRISGSTS